MHDNHSRNDAHAPGDAPVYSYPLGTVARWGEGVSGHQHRADHEAGGSKHNWESRNGVDLPVPEGTPVYAVESGVIHRGFGDGHSKDPALHGTRLHLAGDSHDDYYYAHLSRLAPGIEPGTRVEAGQIIGYSGTAAGVAHLHFSSRSGKTESILRSALDHGIPHLPHDATPHPPHSAHQTQHRGEIGREPHPPSAGGPDQAASNGAAGHGPAGHEGSANSSAPATQAESGPDHSGGSGDAPAQTSPDANFSDGTGKETHVSPDGHSNSSSVSTPTDGATESAPSVLDGNHQPANPSDNVSESVPDHEQAGDGHDTGESAEQHGVTGPVPGDGGVPHSDDQGQNGLSDLGVTPETVEGSTDGSTHADLDFMSEHDPHDASMPDVHDASMPDVHDAAKPR